LHYAEDPFFITRSADLQYMLPHYAPDALYTGYCEWNIFFYFDYTGNRDGDSYQRSHEYFIPYYRILREAHPEICSGVADQC
jgi:hypothetical protein